MLSQEMATQAVSKYANEPYELECRETSFIKVIINKESLNSLQRLCTKHNMDIIILRWTVKPILRARNSTHTHVCRCILVLSTIQGSSLLFAYTVVPWMGGFFLVMKLDIVQNLPLFDGVQTDNSKEPTSKPHRIVCCCASHLDLGAQAHSRGNSYPFFTVFNFRLWFCS